MLCLGGDGLHQLALLRRHRLDLALQPGHILARASGFLTRLVALEPGFGQSLRQPLALGFGVVVHPAQLGMKIVGAAFDLDGARCGLARPLGRVDQLAPQSLAFLSRGPQLGFQPASPALQALQFLDGSRTP